MRNWISNKAAVLAGVPDRVKNLSTTQEFGEQWQRVLGMQWDPANDIISFKPEPVNITWTKRGVLSQLGKLFDPCGLLSPFLVTGKMLMQQLWKKEQDWDQELDDKAKWQQWLGQWPLLEELHIPRYVQAEVSEDKTMELHVFCDASERAMAAIVYLRTVVNEGVKVFLLASKTQVAPMKVQTIPRLELQACLMAANLARFVKKQINMEDINTTFWSDSAVALAWIKSESHTLKPYVANTVSKIQQLTEAKQWRHVPGKQNPADLASRGVPLQEILKEDNI